MSTITKTFKTHRFQVVVDTSTIIHGPPGAIEPAPHQPQVLSSLSLNPIEGPTCQERDVRSSATRAGPPGREASAAPCLASHGPCEEPGQHPDAKPGRALKGLDSPHGTPAGNDRTKALHLFAAPTWLARHLNGWAPTRPPRDASAASCHSRPHSSKLTSHGPGCIPPGWPFATAMAPTSNMCMPYTHT